MAVNKIVNSTNMAVEIQTSVDKAGDPVFTKKTFSNVRNDADLQAVYDVAEAIKDIFESQTRSTLLNVSSDLVNA
ncbi:MAG: DUF1659 domain-containing protein [Clostridium butyricum]|nr:DUF1659 domain-containing protein [Clostridium butyricum]